MFGHNNSHSLINIILCGLLGIFMAISTVFFKSAYLIFVKVLASFRMSFYAIFIGTWSKIFTCLFLMSFLTMVFIFAETSLIISKDRWTWIKHFCLVYLWSWNHCLSRLFCVLQFSGDLQWLEVHQLTSWKHRFYQNYIIEFWIFLFRITDNFEALFCINLATQR